MISCPPGSISSLKYSALAGAATVSLITSPSSSSISDTSSASDHRPSAARGDRRSEKPLRRTATQLDSQRRHICILRCSLTAEASTPPRSKMGPDKRMRDNALHVLRGREQELLPETGGRRDSRESPSVCGASVLSEDARSKSWPGGRSRRAACEPPARPPQGRQAAASNPARRRRRSRSRPS